MAPDGPRPTSMAPTGVPSTAAVGAALRAIVDQPGRHLDQHVVDHFCERIHRAAEVLADLDLTAKGHDRTASYRYLLAMIGYAIDAAVLGDEPDAPMFSAPYQVHRADWGGACPDAVYRRAWIRDDRAYRLHGQLGNAECLLVELRRSMPPLLLDRDDLDAAPDGRFELHLGGAERRSGWRPIPAGTAGISVREYFGDWLGARRSRLRIDCLDAATAPAPGANARRVAEEFDRVADWIVDGAIEFWAARSREVAGAHLNAFVPELARSGSKLPVAVHGWWDLDGDEALVIELDDPRAEYWGMQLATSLWSTLEFANHQTSLNMTQAEPDGDGRYRLVLCGRDPGVHNWLDTTGLRCGIPILRMWRAQAPPIPTTRVVAVDDVPATLPDARRTTPQERRAQIAERREGVARLITD